MDSIYEDNLVTSFVMLTAGVKLKQSREKQTFVCKRGFFAESLKLATSFNHFSSSLLFTDDRKMTEQCFFSPNNFHEILRHTRKCWERKHKQKRKNINFVSNQIWFSFSDSGLRGMKMTLKRAVISVRFLSVLEHGKGGRETTGNYILCYRRVKCNKNFNNSSDTLHPPPRC